MEIFPFETWNSANHNGVLQMPLESMLTEYMGFILIFHQFWQVFLKRSVHLHPEKVKKCYSRFENGVRKETIEFTNTSGHWSSLSSDALGTKINLHAPITIAAFRNFCPKSIRDKFQFYVPMSKISEKIKALLVNQLLKLIYNKGAIIFYFLLIGT